VTTVSPPRVAQRRALIAAVIDVAVIIVFVAIGRDNHDEGADIGGLVKVAAPFVIALAVAWIATRAWRAPRAVPTGLGLWLITVALGMVLRHTAFDRGTALAFVIVATIFLGLFLVGWRVIVRLATRRR
jgi:hypothetical protein